MAESLLLIMMCFSVKMVLDKSLATRMRGAAAHTGDRCFYSLMGTSKTDIFRRRCLRASFPSPSG